MAFLSYLHVVCEVVSAETDVVNDVFDRYDVFFIVLLVFFLLGTYWDVY